MVETVRRCHSDRSQGHLLGVDVPFNTQNVRAIGIHEKVRAYPELKLPGRVDVRNADPNIFMGHETYV